MKIPNGHMRGQGYVDDANMKGFRTGVSTSWQIRTSRSTAFSVPFSNHTLKLVVATVSMKATYFVCMILKLYPFLSG